MGNRCFNRNQIKDAKMKLKLKEVLPSELIQMDAPDDGETATYDSATRKFDGDSAVGITAGWEKIHETELTSPATSIIVTGLNLEADKVYMMIFLWVNATAKDSDASLYINNDTTPTHYYRQLLVVSGTTMFAERYNDATFIAGFANSVTLSKITMMKAPGTVTKTINEYNEQAPSLTAIVRLDQVYTLTTNVTQIEIRADSVNTMSPGTRLIIFKVIG